MIALRSPSEQIFVYDLETKVRTQLTFEGSNFFPRWSPDGKKIAYDSNFQDPRGGNVIWIMDSDGRNKKDISQHGVGEWREPDWLPDFRILHIRYGQCRNGPCLFIMDTTGTLLQQLTESGTSNHNAKVSPDGRRIIWQRWDVKTQDIAVWMMNEDGNGQVRLTAGWEPDWAPDGRHIIYRKKGDFIPGKPWDDDDPKVHGSLWIMDVETREHRQFLPPQ
jgi:Tol biopolymer transport system component